MPKKPTKLTAKMKGEAWYNTKAKFDFYLNNSDHKQAVVEGTRTNGAHWKIVCDESLKDLMYKLNSSDFYTLFSCEGGKWGGTYVLLRKPRTKKKIKECIEILKDFFSDSVLCIDSEDFTKRLIIYVWRKHQIKNNPDLFRVELMRFGKNIEFGKDFKNENIFKN
jgi:hypothetical protein